MLTPFPRRGGRTFPDRERRARNSLKSPHNSREWLPGRRRVAAVWLLRVGPTPRIWLTAGALLAVACQGGGERPLETSAGLSLAPWGLAEPRRRRCSSVRAGDSTTGGRADTDKRSGPACPRWVGGMLAPLTEPDNRVITDLLLPLLASSTRPAVARALTQRRDFDTRVLRDHST